MKGKAFRGTPRASCSQLGERLPGSLCLPLQQLRLLGGGRVLIEGACPNPFFQGEEEKDPRTPPVIDTPDGDVSPQTLTFHVAGSLGGLGDKCSFLLTDGRFYSKQSILSRRQAVVAFLFPFKTLLSTSWNIGPEYRRE